MTRGKPTVLGAASGAVAGLVAITPASGYVGPMSSIIIGADRGRALLHRRATSSRSSGYDDSLDVVGVHGVGGTWGALATGLFASKAVNEAGGDGLFFGNPGQLWTQIVAVLATYVLAVVGTFVILKVVDAIVGLRVHRRGRGGRPGPLAALGDRLRVGRRLVQRVHDERRRLRRGHAADARPSRGRRIDGPLDFAGRIPLR